MKNALLLFLVAFLISCENENSTNKQENKETTNPVTTGTIDTNMFHQIFAPEFSIVYVWNDCGYGNGKDSIDLLNDGKFDFRLTATFLDNHAFDSCCGNMDCWPSGLSYNFKSLNKIEIATYEDIYSEFSTFTFADTLKVNYRVDTISHWQSRVDLWCNDYPYPHQGAWYYLENDRYLAIRMGDSTDYKYGWIKIGTNTDHNLVFKEYALEK
jgi:hypothetical protein